MDQQEIRDKEEQQAEEAHKVIHIQPRGKIW